MEKPEETLQRGLRDVYLDTTEPSLIDGEQGILLYGGYNIHGLAERSTFPEVTYLLLHGELPTTVQLTRMESDLSASRRLPPEAIEGGGRIMGFGHRVHFGHRVYKVENPRARRPLERSEALGERRGQPK